MLLKVSASSSTASVAGAIAHQVREQGAASVQIIGAAALDQAVKALAVARVPAVRRTGDQLRASFTVIQINGASRTALRLDVSTRGVAAP